MHIVYTESEFSFCTDVNQIKNSELTKTKQTINT